MALLAATMISATQFAGVAAFSPPSGSTVSLPGGAGVIGHPAVSPDGRHVAYIRRDVSAADDPDDPPATDIVIAQLPGGGPFLVVRPSASDLEMRSAVAVTYAVNGRHLYVEAHCQCDSDSILEIDPSDGAVRRIASGIEMAVLRNGPWRGDLLLGVHTCYRSHPGCDYPVHIVTPRGISIYVVPGTSGSDRQARLRSWLASRGWLAW